MTAMNYSISRTKRNFIIISSAFLILNALFLGFFYFFKGPMKASLVQTAIQSILFIAAYCYLMLAFIDYFRFHRLKVLQITTIVILLTEIIGKGYSFINTLKPPVPEVNTFNLPIPRLLFMTIGTIYIVSLLILMIFLFHSKAKQYPALLSIRKYAVAVLLFLILGATVPYFVKPDKIFGTLQLINLTAAIPYIFSIDFAVKLPLEE